MSVFNKISLNIKMILRFGLVAGILGGVNAVTSAALVGKVGEEVISDITLLSIAALIIASGLVTARVSGNPLTGLWAGLAVGLIVSLMATAARVGYSVVFFDFVLRDPAEILGWAHRGSATFVDYLVQDRLGGFINTTLFLGVMGALCGVLGGWMGTLRGFHKNGWRETA